MDNWHVCSGIGSDNARLSRISTSSRANRNGRRSPPEIGGDKVSVYSATTGLQDPHQIQARPGLDCAGRATPTFSVCSGAELEIGWLPQILAQTSNQKIRPGAPGAFDAASFVKLVDVPVRFDRAEGDIHSQAIRMFRPARTNILAVRKAAG
jgi:zinc/manganese transport system substrate-binding protein